MNKETGAKKQLSFFEGITPHGNILISSKIIKENVFLQPKKIKVKVEKNTSASDKIKVELLPTDHYIPQNKRIIIPTKNGPSWVTTAEQVLVHKLKKQKYQGLTAYEVTEVSRISKYIDQIGEHKEWALKRGLIIGAFAKNVQKIPITKNN